MTAVYHVCHVAHGPVRWRWWCTCGDSGDDLALEDAQAVAEFHMFAHQPEPAKEP